MRVKNTRQNETSVNKLTLLIKERRDKMRKFYALPKRKKVIGSLTYPNLIDDNERQFDIETPHYGDDEEDE